MTPDYFIIKAYKGLNNLLKNNEIIVLDFSHFSPNTEGEQNHDIHLMFVSNKASYAALYQKYIQEAKNDTKSVWRKFGKDNQRLIFNFENNTEFKKANRTFTVERTDLLNKNTASNFKPERHFVNTLAEKSGLPGECMIIYAENHGDAQSLVYVLMKNKIGSAKKIDLNESFPECLGKEFENFDQKLRSLLLHEMIESLANEKASSSNQVIITATRNALSQVLSRNMAHNLGSHALNNLTNPEILLAQKEEAYRPPEDLQDLGEDKQLVNQLAIFNQYVKCRMDYLSDITSDTPVMHTNKKVYRELYKDLDRVRLLLNNISGLGINFPFSIEFLFNGEPIEEDSDFLIALPNDLLGCHAIYNILENVIRNTAKHNHEKVVNSEGKLELTTFTLNFKQMRFSENVTDDCFYEVEIFDNIKIAGERQLTAAEVNKFKELSLLSKKNKINNIDYLVAKQNQKLNSSILDEDRKLRNHSLGLLEMEASAAYLRKLEITEIEKNEYLIEYNDAFISKAGELNVLKAFSKDGALGYRFFVSKPTEFLFIGDYKLTQIQLIELANQGITVKSEETLLAELKSDKMGRGGKVFNHQFLVHRKGRDFYKDFKTSLPNRIVSVAEENELNRLLLDGTFEPIEYWVWKKWFDKRAAPKGFTSAKLINSYQLDGQPLTSEEKKCYFIAISHHNTTPQNLKFFADGKIGAVDALSSKAVSRLPEIQNRDLADYTGGLTKSSIKNDIIKFKLFDAYYARILVVDERIQRFANEFQLDISINDIFAASHVDMPKDVDLSAGNFKGIVGDRLEKFLDGNIIAGKGYDFLVIHYSILERMYGSGQSKINEQLKKWSNSTRVIVTSGRGKPTELMSNQVCFLNLSPVLSSFTDSRDKYSINYLLNSARK